MDVTINDLSSMRRMRSRYHAFFVVSAARYRHRAEVLAGICYRETRGGESKLLDVPGPHGLGDFGHGHGLMQIDDRSHPAFCHSDLWFDAARNIDQAAAILESVRAQVTKEIAQFSIIATPDQIEQCTIAGYNCGADPAVHALHHSEGLDTYTTGKDYSAAVLAYAAAYKSLEDRP